MSGFTPFSESLLHDNLKKLAVSSHAVRQMLIHKDIMSRLDQPGDKLSRTQLMFDIQVSNFQYCLAIVVYLSRSDHVLCLINDGQKKTSISVAF